MQTKEQHTNIQLNKLKKAKLISTATKMVQALTQRRCLSSASSSFSCVSFLFAAYARRLGRCCFNTWDPFKNSALNACQRHYMSIGERGYTK
jgi:hypothetical protein